MVVWGTSNKLDRPVLILEDLGAKILRVIA